MEGFYGLEVNAGQAPIKPKIPEGCIFRLMQVALPAGAAEPITLRATPDRKQQPGFVLLTLDPKRAIYHSSVDMVFSGKQDTHFSAEGTGSVHLCGFIQPALEDDDDFLDEEEDDDVEDDDDYGSDIYFGDDEEAEEQLKPAKRRAAVGSGNGQPPAKKLKSEKSKPKSK